MHLCIGQEGVAVGACASLEPDDYITSTHRGHGHLIAKGGELDRMMAELYGKETGYCRGRGGSMHIVDVGLGILGANGIVGAGTQIAAGAGLSSKVRSSGQVVVCFFGDDASTEGMFHESMNLAALWDLPVIFMCENNLYGQFTPYEKHSRVPDVAEKARAYGVPGVIVDGNDVLAVKAATDEAAERARSGGGPTLIECKTYRWHGHMEGDVYGYRTAAEIEEWKKKCPIAGFRSRLISDGVASQEEFDDIDERVEAAVAAAIEFAETSPDPDPSTADGERLLRGAGLRGEFPRAARSTSCRWRWPSSRPCRKRWSVMRASSSWERTWPSGSSASPQACWPSSARIAFWIHRSVRT